MKKQFKPDALGMMARSLPPKRWEEVKEKVARKVKSLNLIERVEALERRAAEQDRKAAEHERRIAALENQPPDPGDTVAGV